MASDIHVVIFTRVLNRCQDIKQIDPGRIGRIRHEWVVFGDPVAVDALHRSSNPRGPGSAGHRRCRP